MHHFRVLPDLGEPSEQALKKTTAEVGTLLPIGPFDDLVLFIGKYRE